jgi:tRNA modification GTPase
MQLYDDKPIIACSTGTNTNTAIGLIRLSGFKDLSNIQQFFSFNLDNVKTRYAHMTNILDGSKVLDNVVLTFYKGPNSYNGENILELAVHGNQINIRNIIELFVRDDKFRHAKEGEFTYRALKNRKLSLSQVEGLDLLLNANSSLMLNQGIQTMQGELHNQYLSLHKSFVDLKAAVELSIDFAEDIGDEQGIKLLKDRTNTLRDQIYSLKERTAGDVSSLMSPTIVLVGQTNAGKSSLFNKMLRNNRSIVSNQAGTTRDYVSELIYINNVNYRFVDTAGIRETVDQIEKIGIERSFDILKSSFFKILVVNPLETDFSDFDVLKKDEHFDLIIITHKDQLPNFKLNEFLNCLPAHSKSIFLDLNSENIFDFIVGDTVSVGPMGANNNGSIEPGNSGPMGAKNNGSIEPGNSGPMGANNNGSLEPEISGPMGAAQSNSSYLEIINSFVTNKYNKLALDNPILVDRHRRVINDIFSKFNEFQKVTCDTDDIAIISSELNLLGHAISELIGIISPDDVLNSIFSNFCIGK